MKINKRSFIVILATALVVIAAFLIVLISAGGKQQKDSSIPDNVVVRTTLSEETDISDTSGETVEETASENEPTQTTPVTESGSIDQNEIQEIATDEEYIVTIENNESIGGF